MELQTHSEEQTSKSILKNAYFLGTTVIALILVMAFFICNRKGNPLSSSGESSSQAESVSIIFSNGDEYDLTEPKSGITLTENELTYNDGTLINSNSKRDAFLKRASFTRGQSDFMIVNNSSNQRYQVNLPDSTKIWLNGKSSIKVPMDFHKSDKRVLQLVGEAYFDVTEINKGNSKQPFVVLTEGQMVEVYGTKFNLAAYPIKKVAKTTLVEGNLKVTPLPENTFVLPQLESADIKSLLPKKEGINVAKEVILRPNQQATFSQGRITIDDVEVEEVIAWQSDNFDYRYLSLERVLKVVSVWYGVSIIFHNEKAKHIPLGGSIDRSMQLKNILNTLSIACEVPIKLIGNKIIVSK